MILFKQNEFHLNIRLSIGKKRRNSCDDDDDSRRKNVNFAHEKTIRVRQKLDNIQMTLLYGIVMKFCVVFEIELHYWNGTKFKYQKQIFNSN